MLFFTRGASLGVWHSVGMFEREVALYRALQAQGVEVSFVTYGDRSEYGYAKRIPGIRILCNWPGWPMERYERWLNWLHSLHFRRCDVIKTNQTDGSQVALRVAHFWSKCFVARCGYMWSSNIGHQFGIDSPTHLYVRNIEQRVFSAADHIIVTTQAMAQDIYTRVPGTETKTSVIPNYVETDRFAPSSIDALPDTVRPYDVIFVGRLEAEKNLKALLGALDELGCRALLIGSGSLGDSLRRDFAHRADRLTWLARVPNTELPTYYSQARLFALVSHYEGHPKTLSEAMASGLPVLGTNVSGIRTVIEHGVNGWLCNTDLGSIRDALRHLLDDAALRAELGRRARIYAEEHFSLPRIIRAELSIYDRLIPG